MLNSDYERYPTITAGGEEMLQLLREHSAAPVYRNQSGNRLLALEVTQQRQFETDIINAQIIRSKGSKPDWLNSFVKSTFDSVPYYRKLGSPALCFEDIPTTSRADLSRDVSAFVPDNLSLERMMQFRTSGTTGHPLLIPSHPVVAARYLAFHRRALQRQGINLTHGAGQVGVVLLGYQRQCFTYVSVNPTLNESGLAKINLYPSEWHHPDDRSSYLSAMEAEIYAGDPISFSELLKLDISVAPRALISVSMALSTGLKQSLHNRFGCPVLDVYSMNEAGPIASYEETLQGHVLLQPDLYVEILDHQGRSVDEGEQGEITLTGGFNFYLPLIRYRTGDFASLSFDDGTAVLKNLSGRYPVRYRLSSGEWINNIDITHTLSEIPMPQFAVHQLANGALVLRLPVASRCYAEKSMQKLRKLFQLDEVALEFFQPEDKMIQYTSDMEGALI